MVMWRNRLTLILPLRYFQYFVLLLVVLLIAPRITGVHSSWLFTRFLFACPLAAAVLTDHSFRTTGSWVMLANLGIPRWIALAAVTAAGTLAALALLPFAPLIDHLP